MKKNILILSTSPRKNGNSEMLAFVPVGLCVQGHLSAGNGGGQRGEFNGRGRQRLGGLDRLF